MTVPTARAACCPAARDQTATVYKGRFPVAAKGEMPTSAPRLASLMVEKPDHGMNSDVPDAAAIKCVSRGRWMRRVAADDPDQRCRSTATKNGACHLTLTQAGIPPPT